MYLTSKAWPEYTNQWRCEWKDHHTESNWLAPWNSVVNLLTVEPLLKETVHSLKFFFQHRIPRVCPRVFSKKLAIIASWKIRMDAAEYFYLGLQSIQFISEVDEVEAVVLETEWCARWWLPHFAYPLIYVIGCQMTNESLMMLSNASGVCCWDDSMSVRIISCTCYVASFVLRTP